MTTTSPSLSWFASDIEQRFGVRGGRFTRANSLFTFAIAVVLTVAAYLCMLPFHHHRFVQMFTDRGAVQYVIVLFSFWSLIMLAVKWQKVRLQARALRTRLVPDSPDFVLSVATVGDVLNRLHALCDDPRQFVLFNRIEMALSNLRNMGRISDLDDALKSNAENDEDAMESSFTLLRGLVWAIPVLGFIGTVQGLSMAIGNFGSVLGSTAEISAIKPALQGVTAGLAIAFETTFVGLVAALAIQLILTGVKRREEQLLDDCREYCQRQLVSKLRITPFDMGR
jgi:biopolymer transport protein ExbB/TolQ